MSTMPDVDTTTTSAIAWWNALDHGASSLDPADLVTYSGVDTWTEYDNGITGTLTRHASLRWRAKTDGWIVVSANRKDSNPYTPMKGFTNATTSSVTINVLSEELNGLRKAADNSANMTFNHSDVGLYWYTYPDAGTATILKNNYENSAYWGYQPNYKPSGMWIKGIADDDNNPCAVRFDGNEICKVGSAGGHDEGLFDIIAQGWIPSASTFYDVDCVGYGGDNKAYCRILSLR